MRCRCKQGLHRHVSNNIGFMNFPIEIVVAFPSRAVAAIPLSSTVQFSLDPLTVNDPQQQSDASAISCHSFR